MIASSVSWAPWMSELFATRLRSTALSIFNWGRLISMTAPLITGYIAQRHGLSTAMLLSAVAFAAEASRGCRRRKRSTVEPDLSCLERMPKGAMTGECR